MNYNKKTIMDVDVAGKKILLRCDFNVPQDKETHAITSDKRIVASIPTIRYLLERGAAVIACSHLGKPKGQWKDSLTLRPVAERLSQLLGQEVIFAKDIVGEDAKAKAAALQGGQIMLLENLRFDPREEKNDPEFARELASMAELYVSDAFGTVPPVWRPSCLPCPACWWPGSWRSWAVLWKTPSVPSWPCWAGPRCPTRSASSTTCWKRPTPSSLAAAWPIRLPGHRAAPSARACARTISWTTPAR